MLKSIFKHQTKQKIIIYVSWTDSQELLYTVLLEQIDL